MAGFMLVAVAATFLVGFIGEAVGRPICRRLFHRPAVATAASAGLCVIVAGVASRGSLGTIAIVLLVWSWGWAVGGMVSGESRRSEKLGRSS